MQTCIQNNLSILIEQKICRLIDILDYAFNLRISETSYQFTHTDVTIGSLTTAVNPTDSDESKVISHKRVHLQRFDDDEIYKAITVYDTLKTMNNVQQNISNHVTIDTNQAVGIVMDKREDKRSWSSIITISAIMAGTLS
ncbi:hypothetical protein T4D_10699 [Trichinella pseudospiralis]|uniref:Uncharacterized protein n=1 Tax=Trichinella pseudospiralis TaxID=6337 RepID=A0A0V1G308_TRIPS|nr:hypothetical protein T4D_10699 [Trichinella pseudospiralis]